MFLSQPSVLWPTSCLMRMRWRAVKSKFTQPSLPQSNQAFLSLSVRNVCEDTLLPYFLIYILWIHKWRFLQRALSWISWGLERWGLPVHSDSLMGRPMEMTGSVQGWRAPTGALTSKKAHVVDSNSLQSQITPFIYRYPAMFKKVDKVIWCFFHNYHKSKSCFPSVLATFAHTCVTHAVK